MKILQVLVLIVVFVLIANAQEANLSGNVYDAYGALIPEVKVTAINVRGEKFEAKTNDEGRYSLMLPVNLYDEKMSSNFKMAKYEITFNRENSGFEKFVIKDFKFVPVYLGKMNLDIALDSINPEPCGYSGGDCLTTTPIVTRTKTKVSDKISKRPLEKLPKEQNKTKRKTKNNK